MGMGLLQFLFPGGVKIQLLLDGITFLHEWLGKISGEKRESKGQKNMEKIDDRYQGSWIHNFIRGM